jgi:hypothetical protein
MVLMGIEKIRVDDRVEIYEVNKEIGLKELDINKKISFWLVSPFIVLFALVTFTVKMPVRFVIDVKRLSRQLIVALKKNE